MSKWRASMNNHDEEEGPFFPEESGEICPRCRQEYTGICILNIPDCPFQDEDDEDPFADEDAKEPDFEDVKDLDGLLGEDKEAERLVEEDPDDIPIEDLLDSEDSGDTRHGA